MSFTLKTSTLKFTFKFRVLSVAQSHSQWLWSHPHSHFVAMGVALDHKVALGVALGVGPQPLRVTLGHNHYPKLEGGLVSGGFQSELLEQANL